MRIRVHRTAIANPRVIFSRLGYHQAPNGSFERRLGIHVYPRFHVYLTLGEHEAEISLHLDQMKHTHEGSRAHKGQYDSEEVHTEGERIRAALSEKK